MKLVIIESPYSGNVERNLAYARAAVKDSLSRNEAPIAAHLLYTQPGILSEDNARQRKLGMEAGREWRRVCELAVFYVDLGWSSGMEDAAFLYVEAGIPVEERRLFGEWVR